MVAPSFPAFAAALPDSTGMLTFSKNRMIHLLTVWFLGFTQRRLSSRLPQYRNGKRERSMSTGLGQTVIELPRARLSQGDQEKEWRSRLVERYQRRARSV